MAIRRVHILLFHQSQSRAYDSVQGIGLDYEGDHCDEEPQQNKAVGMFQDQGVLVDKALALEDLADSGHGQSGPLVLEMNRGFLDFVFESDDWAS